MQGKLQEDQPEGLMVASCTAMWNIRLQINPSLFWFCKVSGNCRTLGYLLRVLQGPIWGVSRAFCSAEKHPEHLGEAYSSWKITPGWFRLHLSLVQRGHNGKMQPVMRWGGGGKSQSLPKAPLLFSECSRGEESQMAHAWGSEWMKDTFTHVTENFKAKLMDNC